MPTSGVQCQFRYEENVKYVSALLGNVVEQAAPVHAPPPPLPPIVVPETADRDDTKALIRASPG